MKGHPLHPALVHFPLACWVLATLVDVISQFVLLPSVSGATWAALSHLLLWGGVVIALPAMIAGLVDYARLDHEVQECAELMWHILVMGTAWAIFLGAAIWRVRAAPFDSPASWPVTMLELLGSVLLVVGGYLASIIVFDRIPKAKAASYAEPDQETKQ
ncbi:MAG TPA: hypothetical protein PKK10_14750 [Woeseiaceae bacterium]|nr:hypothetical protein [Woeseiaceae bacterium]